LILVAMAFLCWLDAGKPKFGYYFDNMKRTRATFKLALRYCKNHIDELKADACAESLFNKDPRKFWKDVYTRSPAKQGLADRTAKSAVSVAI